MKNFLVGACIAIASAFPAWAQRTYVVTQPHFYFNESTGSNSNDCRSLATACADIAYTVKEAITKYDYGATAGPVIHLPHGQTINQAGNPLNIVHALVGGGRDVGTFGGLGGSVIEIVGNDLDLGSYIFQCPCIYGYQNLLLAHGFTLRGANTQPPLGNFGIQVLGNDGRAVVYNTRVVNFGTYNPATHIWTNQSYGQPFGAGNGGQLFFGNPDFSQGSYTQIDSDTWTFITQSNSVVTIWPGHRFQINAPVHSEYWINPVQVATTQTLGQALEFAGLGVAGSTGNPFVCSTNSIIAFAGTMFPGVQTLPDGGKYTGCRVNGQ